jgi:glycine/D-amino acid oxidase-like deaminating enzyme
LHSPIIQARPDGAARLLLHWNATDATLVFDPRPPAAMPQARDLVRRLRTLMPVIGDVEPEAARMAIRPIPGDSRSAVGPVPRLDGYYLAVTHSGVTMSPFLGAAVRTRSHGRHGRSLPIPPGTVFQLRLRLLCAATLGLELPITRLAPAHEPR